MVTRARSIRRQRPQANYGVRAIRVRAIRRPGRRIAVSTSWESAARASTDTVAIPQEANEAAEAVGEEIADELADTNETITRLNTDRAAFEDLSMQQAESYGTGREDCAAS
ncbi:hypothetical protein TSOC_010812 [Tetrabaena socialis]|uniref:Uncharacterized protein n=1 Tax=Tetrabaena socialis TaxID=47790 RepID=A0A2J7ZSE1_9CHLO|nr:hypothetical protein TSOC_010810 [Tetrabaena socialis]PNH03192.1 hypothetical protein TSOC_010812 [Tetrabaena socialis]|eukprot:PNH03191.1 hypothetical protein TSOC_010810 [Tetrabaena socialis]